MQGNGAQYKIRAILETNDIKSNAKQIQNALTGIKLPKGMKSQFLSLFDELDQSVDSFQSKLNQGFKKGSDITALKKNADQISKVYQSIIRNVEKMGEGNVKSLVKFDTQEIEEAKRKIADLQNQLHKEVEASGLDKVTETMKKLKTVSKNQNLDSFFKAFNSGDLQTAQKHLENLRKSAAGFSNTANLQVFNQGLDQLEASLKTLGSSSALPQIIANIARMDGELTNLKDEEIQKMVTFLEQAADASREAAQASKVYTNSVVDSTTAQHRLNQEVSEVKDRVKYFLSLANGVELFKRAVRDAFETVKELDAVMTETAVVTEFDVGDMWDKLPEYTKLANQLGATIKGTYETMTLFYQQGLTTNEVFAVGAETMKMARIAGLEYEKATNLMTAALRGFNMALNETSAGRINDVYSKLAAITASSTGEIADAMTKTASIANSANMQFETTAAFLAQMIETTREPAENLGTAMKTIIARFTEMKEAPSDIFEFDGEEVSVNKVDAALAFVGVSLKDAKGKFRELDQVLLELASKWDSLDIMSQRYVATMAAGSRQQSRFIAMMSNYERTMELVNAAQNSAGASQEQFEKTQESLEAKINKLKNAWHEYILGISNSSVIKGMVDLLTKLLETINKLTNSSNGFFSSIGKIGVAFGTFKIARGAFNKVSTGLSSILGNAMKEAGVGAGAQFAQGFGDSAKKSQGLFSGIAKDISTAFVNRSLYDNSQIVGLKKSAKAFKDMENAAKASGNATLQFNSIMKGFGSTLTLNTKQNALFNQAIKSGKTGLQAYTMAVVADSSSLKLRELAQRDNLDEATAALLIESKLAEERKESAAATMFQTQAETMLNNERQRGNTVSAIQMFTEKVNGANTKTSKFNSLISNSGGGLKGFGKAMKSSFKGVGNSLKGLGKSAVQLAKNLGPIIGIVAGIALAAAGIYGAIKMENKDADFAKKMKENYEGATAAVESANQAFQDTVSILDQLDGAENKIKALEKGTVEWRQAVLENNQAIMELLDKYPQLAEYVNNVDGKLTISEEGEEKAQELAQQKLANAQVGQAIAATEMAEAETKAAKEKLADYTQAHSSSSQGAAAAAGAGAIIAGVAVGALISIITGGIGTGLGVALAGATIGGAALAGTAASNAMAEEDTEKILEGFKEHPEYWSSKDNDRLKELAKSVGLTTEELYEMKDSLQEFVAVEAKNAAAIENQRKAAFGAGASKELLEDELSDNYITAFAVNQSAEGLSAAKVEAEMKKLGWDAWGYEGVTKQLSAMGITEDFGSQTEAITRLYAELTGQTVEDVEALDLGKEELYRKIAEINVGNQYANTMNDFYKKHGQEEGAKKLMETYGLDTLETAVTNGRQDTASFAKLLGISPDKLTEYATDMGYETADALVQNFNKRVKQGDNLIKNSFKTGLNSEEVKKIKKQINSLDDEKKEIALQLIRDGETFRDYEHFISTVDNKKVVVTLQKNSDNAAALGEVAEYLGEKLTLEGMEEEQLDKFNAALSQMKSLYDENKTAADDWAQVSKKAIADQLIYLNKLTQVQAGSSPSDGGAGDQQAAANEELYQKARKAQQELQGLKLVRSQLAQEFNKKLKLGVDTTELDRLKRTIEEVDIQIENLSGFEEIPDPFAAIISSAETLISLSDSLFDSAKLIGKGFIVAADDIGTLRKQMPELLKGAKLVGDGTIKLSEETAEKVLGDYADIVKGDAKSTAERIDNKIIEIDADIQAAKTRLNLAKQVKEGTLKLDAQTLKKLVNNTQVAAEFQQNASNKTTAVVGANAAIQEKNNNTVGQAAVNQANDVEKIGTASENSSKKVQSTTQAMITNYYKGGLQAYEHAKATNSIGGTPYKPAKYSAGGTGAGGNTGNHKKTTKNYGAILNSPNPNLLNSKSQKWVENPLKPGTMVPTGQIDPKKLVDNMNSSLPQKGMYANDFAWRSAVRDKIANTDLGQQIGPAASTKLAAAVTGSAIVPNVKDVKYDRMTDDDFDIDLYIEDTLEYIQQLEGYKTELEAYKIELLAKADQSSYNLNKAASGEGGDPKSRKSGSDKGSKKKVEYFKDETDKSWNTLEAINLKNREQEKLQTAYDNLVEDDTATLQDLINNLDAQEASMLAEQTLDKNLIKERRAQLNNILNRSGNQKYRKYAKVDSQNGSVTFNFELIEKEIEGKDKDSDFVKGWEQYQKDLETAAKNIKEAIDLEAKTQQDIIELRKINAEKDFKDNRYNNSITWLVAVLSELETQTAEMEILEKEFDALIKSTEATPRQIANSLLRQIDNLSGQEAYQKEVIRLNEHYLREYLNEYKKYQQYADYDWATKEVKIDADAIGKVVNKEKGEEISQYIDELEKYRDAINQANSTLYDIEANTQELKNYGKSEYADFEQRVWDAIVKQKQDELDELQEINDTIKDNAKDLADSFRESLEKERQARENAEKEKSIGDKEARLSYLRRDTTGANREEIMALEKELKEEKQDYTDTLIDQKLSEIEAQNDIAGKQREEMIEKLEKEIKLLEKNPDWGRVSALIQTSIGDNGTMNKNSALYLLLAKAEEADKMSSTQRENWDKELTEEFNKGYGGAVIQSNQLENLGIYSKGNTVAFYDKYGALRTGKYDGNGNVVVTKDGKNYTYKEIYKDALGVLRTYEDTPQGVAIPVPTPPAPAPAPTPAPSGGSSSSSSNRAPTPAPAPAPTIGVGSSVIVNKNATHFGSKSNNYRMKDFVPGGSYTVYKLESGQALIGNNGAYTGWVNLRDLTLKNSGSSSNSGTSSSNSTTTSGAGYFKTPNYNGGALVDGLKASVYGSNPKNWPSNQKLYDKIGGNLDKLSSVNGDKSRSQMLTLLKQGKLKKIKAFAKGGLVDFTGPAWLDGSKTRPEAFLSAADTRNFMELKDALASLKGYGGRQEKKEVVNNAQFTINVNVDKIDSDYDVDRMVERIKKDILSNSQYRNVTSLNFRR